MVKKRELFPKPIFDEEALLDFLDRHGVKKVHAGKIWRQLLMDPKHDFEKLKRLQIPARIIPALKHEFAYCTSKLTGFERSELDGTVKMLIQLQDGPEIEAVIINHTGEEVGGESGKEMKDGTGARVELRKTLCVSSQSGCRLGCTFCATGTMKLEGNLWAGEIMEQLIHADAVLRVIYRQQAANVALKMHKELDTIVEEAEEDAETAEKEKDGNLSDTSTHDSDEKHEAETNLGSNAGLNLEEILKEAQKLNNAYLGSDQLGGGSTGGRGTSMVTNADGFTYMATTVQNIVFMGMGEPLENYENVVASLQGLSDPQRFGLAMRNFTVSTVGIVPRMRDLLLKLPNVKMALSLHGANEKLRNEIVPVSKNYSLESLIEVLDEYSARHASDGKRKGMVMISYIMIDGVNDYDEACEDLVKMCKGRPVIVNLIPFNKFDPYQGNNLKPGQIHPAASYQTSKPERMQHFMRRLEANDIRVFERRPHGRDISAACGQLAKRSCKDKDSLNKVPDIEGALKVNSVVPLSRDLMKNKKKDEAEEKGCDDEKKLGSKPSGSKPSGCPFSDGTLMNNIILGSAVVLFAATVGAMWLKDRRKR